MNLQYYNGSLDIRVVVSHLCVKYQNACKPQLHVKQQNNHYLKLEQHYVNDLGLSLAIKHCLSGARGVIS